MARLFGHPSLRLDAHWTPVHDEPGRWVLTINLYEDHVCYATIVHTVDGEWSSEADVAYALEELGKRMVEG